MRKSTAMFLALVLTMALAACGGPSLAAPTNAPTSAPTATVTAAPAVTPTVQPAQASAGGLAGTWHWAQIVDANGTSTNVTNPSAYSVSFDASTNNVSIATDCNSAMGSYATDGQSLTIKLAAMTQATCPGNNQARQFLGTLGAVQSYSLDGAQLVLHLNGGGSLRLGR